MQTVITYIFGKRWRMLFVPASELPKPRDRDGECVVPETPAHRIPVREMRIYDKLTGQQMLETICHEFGHAADPEKREEFVTHYAADLSRLLWKLGYRRKGHDDGC